MKRLFTALMIFGILPAFAQIQVTKDTVYIDLEQGVKKDAYIDVSYGGSDVTTLFWTIIEDEYKTVGDWEVEFCDCNTCSKDYKTQDVCPQDDFTNSTTYPYAAYITTNESFGDRVLRVRLVNQKNQSDADTITFISRSPSSAGISIASMTPMMGKVAEEVTITGSGFAATASDNMVHFNGVKANVTSATATELKVKVPGGAMDGKVTVTASGNTATSGDAFTVTSGVGIEQIKDVVSKVYVAHSTLHIEFADGTGEAMNLNVVDMNGRTVMSKPVIVESNGQVVEINIDALESGVYVLSTGFGTHKFVK